MSRSFCVSARPPTCVTHGLDPRVHLLRKKLFAKKMDCTGEILPIIGGHSGG
jgi:hypothetical protein